MPKPRSKSGTTRTRLESIPGTRRAPHPAFTEPCHPTLQNRTPTGDQWVHEAKLDGYRAQVHIRGDAITIYTRGGNDWTDRFMGIVRALKLRRDAVIDGEIVALDDEGRPDFHFLQLAFGRSASDRLVFFAFDLLYLDGFDLRDVPLLKRRELLMELHREYGNSTFRLSEAFDAEGASVFASVRQMGLEGVVSKRKDSRYRSGRQSSWIKVKVVRSETFTVVGFTSATGLLPPRVDGLYLARRQDKMLLYAGKAETGFNDSSAIDLYKRLSALARKTSPLSVPVRKPKATWVEPQLQVEIEFTGETSDGHLRHPSYKGLREDLE